MKELFAWEGEVMSDLITRLRELMHPHAEEAVEELQEKEAQIERLKGELKSGVIKEPNAIDRDTIEAMVAQLKRLADGMALLEGAIPSRLQGGPLGAGKNPPLPPAQQSCGNCVNYQAGLLGSSASQPPGVSGGVTGRCALNPPIAVLVSPGVSRVNLGQPLQPQVLSVWSQVNASEWCAQWVSM